MKQQKLEQEVAVVSEVQTSWKRTKRQVLGIVGILQTSTDEEGVPKSDPARVGVTSQGSGVQKFRPSTPPESERHHCPKRLRLSSGSMVNLPVKCERFFIGDEDVELIR